MSNLTSDKERVLVYSRVAGGRESGSDLKGSGYLQSKGTSNESLEYQSAPTLPGSLLSVQSQISRHAQILQALKTDAVPSAYVLDVEHAHTQSFAWIFTNESAGFKDWLTNDEPLFWIKGAPGSGKSILMRVICSDDRAKNFVGNAFTKRKHIRGHFALFSDPLLRKPFVNLLHGILYHILDQAPELLGLIEPAFVTLLPLKEKPHEPLPLATLQAALYYLLQQDEYWVDIHLFIDGLDNLVGRHTEVVKFLRQIQKRKNNADTHTRVKICFSCRPERNFFETFASTLGLCIEDHTAQDVEAAVKSLLPKDPRIQSMMRSGREEDGAKVLTLSKAISSKSKGAFVWAQLACVEVHHELDDGKTIDEMITLIDSLPTSLDEYYLRKSLRRIPARYRGEALIMFDIVRFSIQPLSVGQFHACFMNAQINDLHQYIEPTTSGTDSLALVKDLIYSRSGGLLEVKQSRPMQDGQVHQTRVVFVHHTARTFVGRRETREYLSKDVSEFDSGEWFLRYCIARINVFLQDKRDWYDGSTGNVGLQYMTRGLLDHLAMAEQLTDFSLTETLMQLDDKAIAHLYHNPAWTKEREREPLTNLLSVAVAAELEGFVSEYIFGQQRSQKALDSALWVAAALPRKFKVRGNSPARRQRILRLLLGSGASLRAEENGVTPFQALWIYRVRHTEDCYLSEEQHEAGIVTQFLEHGQDPNTKIRYFQQTSTGVLEDRRTYPLHLECQRAGLDTVRTLISHGADVNALDSRQQMPLDEAYASLTSRVSDFLEEFDAGKSADCQTTFPYAKKFQSALLLQAQSDCISLLLDAGARMTNKPNTAILDKGQSGKPVAVTESQLDSLRKEGIEVDLRVLDPSIHQETPARKSSFLHPATKVSPRRLLRHR